MATACMVIDIRGTLESGSRLVFLFRDLEAACDVHTRLAAACKAYHDRANDRETLFTFDHLTGPATVHVANIAALAVENPMGPEQAAIDEWARYQGKQRALLGIVPRQGEVE